MSTPSPGASVPAPIVLSWSGGKDSSLALHALQCDPRYTVVALLTSLTRGYDRVSIHGVRRTLLHAQADRIGLPLHEIELEPESSNAAYERAFHAAVAELRRDDPQVRKLAFGDLFLADVRQYRERLVAAAGCEAIFPLWGRPTASLAVEFIAEGFEAHLVCVDTSQLSMSYAGRRLDQALLAELPSGVDPCGENGEFHTFVSAGPIFSAPIPITVGEVILRDDRFAYCDLLPGDEAAFPPRPDRQPTGRTTAQAPD